MNRHPVQQIHNNNNNNVPLKSLRFISTIMSLLLIISIASSLLVRLRAIENRSLRLEISSPNYLPNDPREFMNFTFNQHTTWILTCKVIPSDRFPPLNITLVNERSARSAHSNFSNSVTLSITNATDADSGEYKCTAQGPDHLLNAKATIRAVKAPCPENLFSCGGTCIFPVYLCDGHPDCPNGLDEDPYFANCSYPICNNRQWCGKRCIPPQWCCTPGQEDCKHPPPCCHNSGFGDVSELRRRDDGFLETTIYIVIGCTTAFLVLLVVLVVAICRFHMKRTSVPRHPRTPMNVAGRVGMTRPPGRVMPGMGDFDVYLNQALIDLSQHSGFLVTYNINSGVQLMGRPVDPPPYCEVVSPPPMGGPPPPYVPRECTRLQAEESEDAVHSEDDALLRGVRDFNRPMDENDCSPPGTDQSHSRRASEDNIPCGSEITRVDITVVPPRKGKPTVSSISVPSPAVAVMTDETNFKQICSSSPSVDQKDSAG